MKGQFAIEILAKNGKWQTIDYVVGTTRDVIDYLATYGTKKIYRARPDNDHRGVNPPKEIKFTRPSDL